MDEDAMLSNSTSRSAGSRVSVVYASGRLGVGPVMGRCAITDIL
jgi:hypothetical protein